MQKLIISKCFSTQKHLSSPLENQKICFQIQKTLKKWFFGISTFYHDAQFTKKIPTLYANMYFFAAIFFHFYIKKSFKKCKKHGNRIFCPRLEWAAPKHWSKYTANLFEVFLIYDTCKVLHEDNVSQYSLREQPGPIAERSNSSFITNCRGRGNPSLNPVVGWRTKWKTYCCFHT